MPTYEYLCSKCEQTFEIVQSMKDPHLETCPENKCRQETWGHGCVKRQLGTGAGLIFKGSGFYITDYRSDNYKEGAKKETAGASGGETAKKETAGASGGETAKGKTDAPAPAPKPEPAKTPAPPAKGGPA